jgi:N-acetylglucosamine repressor
VGVTVDVESCEIASAGFDGVLREATRDRFPTPQDYDGLVSAIAERARELDSPAMPILCMGISVVGLVDYLRKEIRLAANLPFLDGKSLAYDLRRELDVECAMVHDAHALCLAEYVYGQATNFDTFAVLDMSTGIGLGVMINNVFLTGHSGFAGEMGHIPVAAGGDLCRCGRRGCLETVASEWAFIERASQRLGRPIEFDELMTLAADKNPAVIHELDQMCDHLAVALAQIINLFDPQGVFFNGRLFEAMPALREQLVERARRLALEPALADCQFLPTSGSHLLGAVATAISSVTSSRVHELQDTLTGIPFNVTRRSVN